MSMNKPLKRSQLEKKREYEPSKDLKIWTSLSDVYQRTIRELRDVVEQSTIQAYCNNAFANSDILHNPDDRKMLFFNLPMTGNGKGRMPRTVKIYTVHDG